MVNLASRPRPPGRTAGLTTTTKSIWAWTLLALYATTGQTANSDYIPNVRRPRSATTREAHVASQRTKAGGSPAESPLLDYPTPKFRNTREYFDVVAYPNALAPAPREGSAVEAPLAQSGEALGPQALGARPLQDWEAADIILLSTIDGALHAHDRRTGQSRWTLNTNEPMIGAVRTLNEQSDQEEEEASPVGYKFFVEPSPDGQLFALFSDPRLGLVRSHTTVRKMAVESPFHMVLNDVRFIITSVIRSKSYVIDAASGELLNQFPRQRGWGKGDLQPRCRRKNQLELADPACESGLVIRMGRNTYEFTVSDEMTGAEVYSITFSEWVSYANDKDLQEQYRQSFDGLEIQSRSNGRIIGLDTNADEGRMHRYTHVLNSTLARVYDVITQVDDKHESSELVVLARPDDLPLPAKYQALREKSRRNEYIFINKTEDGMWYAMSEQSYPGITLGVPMARVTYKQTDRLLDLSGELDDIVGVHQFSVFKKGTAPLLTIESGNGIEGSPQSEEADLQATDFARPPVNPLINEPAVSTSVLIPYTLLLCILVVWLVTQKDYVKEFLRMKTRKARAAINMSIIEQDAAVPAQTLPVEANVQTDRVAVHSDALHPTVVETQLPEAPAPSRSRGQSSSSGSGNGSANPLTSPKKRVKLGDQDDEDSDGDSDDEEYQEVASTQTNGLKPKKKTKRGKRGGRKNKRKTMDPSTFDEKPTLAMEQHLDGGMLQIGTLKIDTREDGCLGRGSNGTTVYPGLFHGREVAVKRLIKSTNDLAKKEIKHLMSSDENSHVVRFHTHEESRDFFYIALDRFTTSLDQFIERPETFPSLISGTKGFDVKDCLRQITGGVQHLHSLKLVHRDIKPQNVLVKPVRSNRPTPDMPPLLFVISDFGLCKPLEEGAMSTFAPTANHTAAGTTGWRAPELLVGPRDTIAAPSAESTQSVSTNHSRDGTVIDPPTGRRATKAIDIFSLGCVFYYVMTQGGHPFDKGGTSLGRDLNIKENNMTTELLQLHRYEYDADDLIMQMLKHEPKERPDCARVLRHPYFWSQEQKLDFICLVSDSYEGEKNSINNIHDEHAVRTSAELAAFAELGALESLSGNVIGTKHDGSVRDFLSALPKSFINEMGKQRKYTGTKMIDLLRVIRNKKNHFKDLPADIKEIMSKNAEGQLAGYYQFWAERFPSLLINCHALVIERDLVVKFGLERWYE